MTGSTESALRIENLHIGYTSSPPLRRHSIYGPINIEIPRAELVGIIGRNGVGKSTLLRTLAGIQDPLSGMIYIQGTEKRKIHKADLARLISFVSTDPVKVQNLKVIELVALGRFPYTNWFGRLDSNDKTIIQEAVKQTGITNLLSKSVHQLSDGERQKVVISRALAQDTPIIVLDEPTAFLDLPARHEILRLLNKLSRDHGKLILFSTHDLSIAMDEVDKLWLMTDEGIYDGSPEDLLINQVFRKLFINSSIEFDSKSMVFRFKKDYKNKIIIYADEPYHSITRNAMERIGIQTVLTGKADFSLTILVENEAPVWQLAGNKNNLNFQSIYDLVSYFTNLWKHE